MSYFDDAIEEICLSKAFVGPATGGRHLGLSIIYIRHNLLHQSKLGRDVYAPEHARCSLQIFP